MGWRLAAVLAALLLAGALGTAAQAQLGDVGEQTEVDTDYTPRAKDSERWRWVSGAQYREGAPSPSDVPEESVTPFELDFFAVAFREKESFTDTDAGFAGGAECRDPVPADDPAPNAYTVRAAVEGEAHR